MVVSQWCICGGFSEDRTVSLQKKNIVNMIDGQVCDIYDGPLEGRCPDEILLTNDHTPLLRTLSSILRVSEVGCRKRFQYAFVIYTPVLIDH